MSITSLVSSALVGLVALGVSSEVWAQHDGHNKGHDPHAHHRKMMKDTAFTRSEHAYKIDPEQDTPERLRAYANRFKAAPSWQFPAGSLADIVKVEKAFNAYASDKLNHRPVTFLRTRPNAPWVRLDGFASAGEVVAEYRYLKSGGGR